MARFEQKLVLSQWMLKQFGVTDLEIAGKTLSADHLTGFDEENSSRYLHELMIWMPEESRVVRNDLLRQYDDNIVKHWQQITCKRNHSGGGILYPLYFQYLSILFTEHYLNRYFSDKSALCTELNHFLAGHNHAFPEKHRIEPFRESELNKLATWIATGGGKTLIMHVNILQFRHYSKKAGRETAFSHTILLTPNEGLSLQHKKEMDMSGLHAELFARDGGALFKQTAIQIIDIHKIREKQGEKTIAVESFESGNLVLVDEGHRGAGGVDWMTKRNQLCETGFSFEYSATFGQAIKATPGSDAAPRGNAKASAKYRLIQQYSKCILFDYSYRFFHGDGYGKDHVILNLSDAWNSDQVQLYLTGCIVNFYQQKKLFRDKQQSITEYLPADPLWIFAGGKVTARNEANADTVSDIQAIIQFLARFIANNGGESVHFIDLFLKQQDELRDIHGNPIFAGVFNYLQNLWPTGRAGAAFSDVLKLVFNAETSGLLHIVHLTGSNGEIGLRVGENRWFGVINVGDSSKLIRLCEEAAIAGTSVTSQSFSDSLFQDINKKDSSVNLLVGAKKFSEGWSSWRVSTMGLMNVGRSEGSEIIQLFGRGVRLKGYGFTLKRSNHIPGTRHPEHLQNLETLTVFGIRSDYMREFREYLEEEGVGKKTTDVIVLPVIKRLNRSDLKLIRVREDIKPFKQASKPFLEKQPDGMQGKVILNWYPGIQARASITRAAVALDTSPHEGWLEEKHLAFLDYNEIYFELVQYKNEKAWYNLQLDRHQIKELLSDTSWYRLQIPADMLEVKDFERVHMWQEIAIALLKKYAERYYNFRKQEYEAPHLEYYDVNENDDNFMDAYKATINQEADEWINKINELKNRLEKGTFRDSWSFGNLKVFDFSRHQYQPLIHFSNNEIMKLSPVPLNEGEYDFIQDLKRFHTDSRDYFQEKELYVLRNQGKGKGVSFFEAGNFHPDFILWLIIDKKQYVSFVDPKGLLHIRGFDDPKIRFHKIIKQIQERLKDPDVILNSFIVSNTFQRDIDWWSKGDNGQKDVINHHVLFQKEDKATYINKIFEMTVNQAVQ